MTRIIQPKMFKLKTFYIALIFAFVPALSAQQAAQQTAQQTAQPAQTAAPASASSVAVVPAPPQPNALRKVFISNLPSEDGGYYSPDQVYNTFYAAMKRAGQYELVSDPAQADLLFELLSVRPWHCVPDSSAGTLEVPMDSEMEEFDQAFGVTALDRKTHAVLETHDTDLKQKQKTLDKNFEKAMETLVEAMGTGPIPKESAAALPGKPSPAPGPSPLGAATKLFISNPVVDKTRMMENHQAFYSQVSAAMNSWGRYKLVSNAADADLVADLAVTQAWGPKCRDVQVPASLRHLELRITDPKTNTLIWGFAESFLGGHTLFSRGGSFASSEGELKKTSVSLVKQIRELTARADAAATVPKGPPPPQVSSHRP
jgi:hypothetical protein